MYSCGWILTGSAGCELGPPLSFRLQSKWACQSLQRLSVCLSNLSTSRPQAAVVISQVVLSANSKCSQIPLRPFMASLFLTFRYIAFGANSYS